MRDGQYRGMIRRSQGQNQIIGNVVVVELWKLLTMTASLATSPATLSPGLTALVRPEIDAPSQVRN